MAIFSSTARGAEAVSRLGTKAMRHARTPLSHFHGAKVGRHRKRVFIGKAVRRHRWAWDRSIGTFAGLQKRYHLLGREVGWEAGYWGRGMGPGLGWMGWEPVGAPWRL